MRNLVVSILIPFILLFNLNSAIAFDFAPEIGDTAPNFELEGFNKNIKSKKTFKAIVIDEKKVTPLTNM